jgi:valyl-tRNA synthetase
MNGAFGSTGEIPAATATVNRWIIGETAACAKRSMPRWGLPLQRRGQRALCLCLGQGLRLVCGVFQAAAAPGDDAGQGRNAATMAWVIDQCLILLHPIMPFITEELWGTLGKRKMLVHADWPSYGTDLVDPEADREMNWVISLIENIRSARAQMHVPVGLYIPDAGTELDEKGRAAWERNETLIKRLARIDSLTEADKLPQGLHHRRGRGRQLRPAARGCDRRGRGKGAAGKDARQAGQGTGRAARAAEQPKFVESAPEEVVEEARENLRAREDEDGLTAPASSW